MELVVVLALAAVGYFVYRSVTLKGKGSTAAGRENGRGSVSPARGTESLQEFAAKEKARRQEIFQDANLGTPEERYERAKDLWDSGITANQEVAQKIYQSLIEDDVELSGPYITYGTMLLLTDARAHSGKVLKWFKRAWEVDPIDQAVAKKYQDMLFMHAKLCWDTGRDEESCRTYIDGLNQYTDSGNAFTDGSPIQVRVAFMASRMFSKKALEERGSTDLGVLFFDWCEKAGIDPNADVDISDAKTA